MVRLRTWLTHGSLALRISIGLVLIVLATGLALHFIRPPMGVAVEAELPSSAHAIALSEIDEGGRQSIVADLRALSVSALGGPAPGRAKRPQSQFELVIPVSDLDCRAIAAQTDGKCGGGDARPTPSSRGLAVEWQRNGPAVTTSVSFEGIAAMRLSHTPLSSGDSPLSTWIARPRARRTTFRFLCVEPRAFTLIHDGKVIRGHCVPDQTRLHLGVEFPAAAHPSAAMSGLDRLEIHAVGGEGKLTVHNGNVRVGDSTTPLDNPGPTRVAIRSSGADGVHLDFAASLDGRPSELMLGSSSAESFQVGTAGKPKEMVPDLLSRNIGLVSQLLFLFAGLALGVGLDRLERDRSSTFGRVAK